MFSTPNGNLWPTTSDKQHTIMPYSTLSAVPAHVGGPAPQSAEKYSAISEFEGVFGQGSGPLTGGSGTVTSQQAGLDWNMQTSTSRGYTGGGPAGGSAGHHAVAGQHIVAGQHAVAGQQHAAGMNFSLPLYITGWFSYGGMSLINCTNGGNYCNSGSPSE